MIEPVYGHLKSVAGSDGYHPLCTTRRGYLAVWLRHQFLQTS